MDKIYQQNLFGGEDEIATRIPVYVFKNALTGRYLAADYDHMQMPDGDVDELTDMYMYFNDDYTEPSAQKALVKLSYGFGGPSIEGYEPELRYITVGEFDRWADEHKLPRYKGVCI